jgi:crotonobetainyl-CoA:carnitine CoA-transferase CaiB-like acyl-CoA transferase
MHEYMGGHATKCTNWVIDWASGTLITYGVLASIHWRRKTGLGTMLEVSQVQTPTRFLGYTTPLYGRFGIVRQRWGNWDTQLCAHGVILCGKSDYPDAENPQEKFDARYAMVSAFNDADFKELCSLTGQKALWDSYPTHKQRLEGEAQVEVYEALEAWAADKSRSEVCDALNNAGILAYPVKSHREVYESEHLRQRGTIRWLDDPLFGDLLAHCTYSTGLMSKSPRRLKWQWRPVGADNVKIYRDMLGIPISQIEEWYEKAWI